jgi:bifunctional DNA-binding transcriptional regulator/antitoxin component of YhaV-PrlF toxin-antitoxin module
MSVYSEGAVTLPGEVRKALAIEPGAEVECELDGDGAPIRRAPVGASPADPAERARSVSTGQLTMPFDEWYRRTRDEPSAGVGPSKRIAATGAGLAHGRGDVMELTRSEP